MIYFCFIEDGPSAPRMAVLTATEPEAAALEARALPLERGLQAHIFDGDAFVATVVTEGPCPPAKPPLPDAGDPRKAAYAMAGIYLQTPPLLVR